MRNECERTALLHNDTIRSHFLFKLGKLQNAVKSTGEETVCMISVGEEVAGINTYGLIDAVAVRAHCSAQKELWQNYLIFYDSQLRK